MKRLLLIIAMVLAIDLNTYADEPTEDYTSYLIAVCETYELDPSLVEAVIITESNWCTSASSPTGGIQGLMGISLKWNKDRMERLGCKDMLNPYQNILVGCDLLAELIETYDGDIEKALDRYNGNLHSDEWYEQGNHTKYYRKVMRLQNLIKEEVPESCELN